MHRSILKILFNTTYIKLPPFILNWKFNCIAGTFCKKVKFIDDYIEYFICNPKDIKTIHHKQIHNLEEVAIGKKCNVWWKRYFYVARRVESMMSRKTRSYDVADLKEALK